MREGGNVSINGRLFGGFYFSVLLGVSLSLLIGRCQLTCIVARMRASGHERHIGTMTLNTALQRLYCCYAWI
jgi:hypothetical protein